MYHEDPHRNDTTHQLKRLQSALPPLLRPTELRNKIVDAARQLMDITETIDLLNNETNYFYSSHEPFSNLERDAQILELRTDKIRLQLLFLQNHMQTLHAMVPLLIATNKVSHTAWETMMTTLEEYVPKNDDNNEKRPLPYQQETTSTIINDQLIAIDALFSKIREIRTDCLNEERAQQECDQHQIATSLKSLQKTLNEMHQHFATSTTPEDNQSTSQLRTNEKRKIEANIEFMEGLEELDEPVPKQRKITKDTSNKKQINDEIQDLRRTAITYMRHFLSVARKRTCFIRLYQKGVGSDEKTMRCPFYQAQGDHYADSCDIIKTGQERRRFLDRANRCTICLELQCPQGNKCPKFNKRCIHCQKKGHNSAVCHLPDYSQQIRQEQEECIEKIEKAIVRLNSSVAK
ncbi:unnamed protein product [Nippostrongylus brasiliensis]|uniref:CCHC-type domain-containing protein n=1 Tax=Nippostrongylus brasiliensis TaxID=27835 RepID=A0A0N4YTY5_NIPBR|nr:unnamed protein product [Nippostrongylus brasiliensis]